MRGVEGVAGVDLSEQEGEEAGVVAVAGDAGSDKKPAVSPQSNECCCNSFVFANLRCLHTALDVGPEFF
jgi:hypothetical protein